MNNREFDMLLNKGVNRWENRELLVNSALAKQELVLVLLKNMQEVSVKNSTYSARILELIVKKDKKSLLPYIDQFCELLNLLKFDGSVRASAKIIELYCIEYFLKKHPEFIEKLTDETFEFFTEACFDWMITNRATAIQAHAMYALYLMGFNSNFDWVHEELVKTIEKNFSMHTIGYQNRGAKIVAAISSNQLFKL